MLERQHWAQSNNVSKKNVYHKGDKRQAEPGKVLGSPFVRRHGIFPSLSLPSYLVGNFRERFETKRRIRHEAFSQSSCRHRNQHHADAATSDAFRPAIEQAIRDGVDRIVVVGFQFTTCVAASALSTIEMVRGRGVRVTVIEALTGIRASSHVAGASGVSRVESTRRHLETAGVELT